MTPYFSRDGIVLYNADCRDVLPSLPKVDLVLTDPPYGITYQSNMAVGQGTAPITNDGTRVSLRLYKAIVPLIADIPTLWFTRWDAWPDVWEIFGGATKINGLLIWEKSSPGMGDLEHWGPSYEMIASCGPLKTTGSRDGSVLRYATVPSSQRMHPTEKPSGLLRYLISKTTEAGETVLDPFCGSGTTLRAAMDLGRKAIGIEISEKYCEIAAKRLEQRNLKFDGVLA